MIEILVYGAGDNGKTLAERVETLYSSEVKIKAFIDKNKTGEIMGIPIISLDSMNGYSLPVVISIEKRQIVMAVYKELKSIGVKDIFMFLNRQNPRYNNSFFEGECSELTGNEESLLPHIEVHAVDYCNLNCKACIHYSGLYKKEEFQKEIVFSDIKEISNLTKDIISFYILGGEPLLREDLGDVIKYARECLPKSDIQVLTNGLLVSERFADLWTVMREANVTLTVSEYEPTSHKSDEIIKVLQNNKVPYIIRPYNYKDKFIKTIALSADSQYKHTCICDGCVNVYKGTIARCPAVMYLEKLNSEFGIELPEDGIYSLEDFTNAKELYAKMVEKIPLCDHCVEYSVDWGQCAAVRKLEDFVITE